MPHLMPNEVDHEEIVTASLREQNMSPLTDNNDDNSSDSNRQNANAINSDQSAQNTTNHLDSAPSTDTSISMTPNENGTEPVNANPTDSRSTNNSISRARSDSLEQGSSGNQQSTPGNTAHTTTAQNAQNNASETERRDTNQSQQSRKRTMEQQVGNIVQSFSTFINGSVFKDPEKTPKMDPVESSKCSICFNVPFINTNVYQCQNGHLYCSKCQPRMEECGTCKADDIAIRNRYIENFIRDHVADIKLPCDNEKCGALIPHRYSEQHSQLCVFREVECPGCKGQAKPWKGRISQLIAHVEEEKCCCFLVDVHWHKLYRTREEYPTFSKVLQDNPMGFRSLFTNQGAIFKPFLLLCRMGLNAMPYVNVEKVNKEWRIIPYCCLQEEYSKYLTVKITLGGPSVKYVYEGPINSAYTWGLNSKHYLEITDNHMHTIRKSKQVDFQSRYLGELTIEVQAHSDFKASVLTLVSCPLNAAASKVHHQMMEEKKRKSEEKAMKDATTEK